MRTYNVLIGVVIAHTFPVSLAACAMKAGSTSRERKASACDTRQVSEIVDELTYWKRMNTSGDGAPIKSTGESNARIAELRRRLANCGVTGGMPCDTLWQTVATDRGVTVQQWQWLGTNFLRAALPSRGLEQHAD